MGKVSEAIAALRSGDDQRAERVVPQLAAAGPAAIEALALLVRSQDADQRWWALRTLAEIDSPQSKAYLRQALADDDPAVRHCAALGLQRQPDEAALPQLIDLLGREDRILARLAGNALAAIGKPATTALLEVLQNGEQTARLEAVRALAEIGDTASVSALFKLLDEDSALMEYWASEGLEKMGIGMTFFKPG